MVMNRLKRVLAFAFAGLALMGLADEYTFKDGCMEVIQGKGKVEAFTLTAETLQYCTDSSKAPVGTWCIGAKITWPGDYKGSTADKASHELLPSGMSSYSDQVETVHMAYGVYWADVVVSTEWYVWITAEEAHAQAGNVFERRHTMSGKAYKKKIYDNTVKAALASF